MSNAWSKFRELLPSDPMRIGKVLTHNDDGTSTVELPGAVQIRARGTTVAINSKAFVQGGRIQGQAPNLPTYTIEV